MAGGRIPRKLNEAELWEYALRVLSRRAHSAGELRQKLAARAEIRSDVDAAMAKLREYGFADDVKFSEAFAGSRLRNRGFGPSRVLHELRAKRIPAAVAADAVEKAFDGADEVQLAHSFLERKYRGKDLKAFLREEKNLAAAYRRLRTGGFSSATALTVLKRYSRQAGEWDGSGEDRGPE